MVMRRTLILIIIVILTISIWAQTEMEENTAQDTLNIETVVIDTLKEKIDPRLLLVEMNNFLDEKREIEDQLFLPHLIYKENFHLSSPFNLNVRIRKNGFSEIPFATGNLQTVQNNRNIFRTIYKRGNIFYNSYGYSLPVAITETYMGLGDKDMNNSWIWSSPLHLNRGTITLEIEAEDLLLDCLALRNSQHIRSAKPKVTFNQIDHTTYKVNIEGGDEPFWLVLNEGFNSPSSFCRRSLKADNKLFISQYMLSLSDRSSNNEITSLKA